ncbi:MAG TPA: EamA family transporter, partial [Microlunatus sp.]|nr:EamA family transporter [Microlunatus sp.]
MTTSPVSSATPVPTSLRHDPAGPVGGGPVRPGCGIAALLTGAASNQTGAAVAAHAFGAIGPVGVVAVRQLVAAVVLLAVARPPLRRLTRAQWVPVLALAAVFATMNLTLYAAIERIGLGLAVTLEFLGPLTIALLASRGRREVVLAAVAATGVYVLVLPGPASDLIGIGLGLVAAVAWAGYILLNQVAGRRLPGLQGPAVASLVSATAYLPVLVWLGLDGALWGRPLLLAVTAGLLSSAVPYAADLTALRHLPAQVFGTLSSIQPVFAAVAGMLILGQWLSTHVWLGIAIIVAANAI